MESICQDSRITAKEDGKETPSSLHISPRILFSEGNPDWSLGSQTLIGNRSLIEDNSLPKKNQLPYMR